MNTLDMELNQKLIKSKFRRRLLWGIYTRENTYARKGGKHLLEGGVFSGATVQGCKKLQLHKQKRKCNSKVQC